MEFETHNAACFCGIFSSCKFTPMEFETFNVAAKNCELALVQIYSDGVWNEYALIRALPRSSCKFPPLEFETYNF